LVNHKNSLTWKGNMRKKERSAEERILRHSLDVKWEKIDQLNMNENC
jgi:hypothetical protein